MKYVEKSLDAVVHLCCNLDLAQHTVIHCPTVHNIVVQWIPFSIGPSQVYHHQVQRINQSSVCSPAVSVARQLFQK